MYEEIRQSNQSRVYNRTYCGDEVAMGRTRGCMKLTEMDIYINTLATMTAWCSVGRPHERTLDDIKLLPGNMWFQLSQPGTAWRIMKETYVQEWAWKVAEEERTK